MSYQTFREVLEIFDKYENNGLIHAEHDTLYAGPDPDLVSEEDIEKLDTLGWFPGDEECFMKYT